MTESNKTTPFWDETLTNEERIDWLLQAMTIDEKLEAVTSHSGDIERLGIPGIPLGGEAAHGVEARNDQNGIGVADVTTSFPQPIGMSASWDTELIEKAGEIVGREARVVADRHQGRGLSRWAPTVDMERDPRWGRNEEGYGEDPVLTGAMAGAYIKGMQGTDKKYLRIAATLKHFYGNNTEVGRGWKNSSIDPRNEYEYYLEPFRRCIEDAGAEGVMTAYNKINGTIGILNPEVTDILKKQYGLTHAVSDGGATGLVVSLHHHFGQHAETVAAAIKAGVDGLSDPPFMAIAAAREAYELGLLKEEDLDRAIRNTMRTKLRLGIYDRHPGNPYMRVTEADLLSEEAYQVCRDLTRNSIVLLKNEKEFLPLDPNMNPEDIALIGPMADAWHQDWYGGKAPYRSTLKKGLSEFFSGAELALADGQDRVTFSCSKGALALDQDGTLVLSDEPDVFIKEYWGEGSYAFKCARTGKYLCVRNYEMSEEEEDRGQIGADREEAFDWFVTEIMHMEEQENGQIILLNRFHYPIYLTEKGIFSSMEDREGTPLTMTVVEDGLKKAVRLAEAKKIVILALGCNAMINAKEEIDRNTLALPEDQENLLLAVAAASPSTVLTLFTNYPYIIKSAKEKLPAILLSATGSQDMGKAMAETLFGVNAPAGRLNMTWYQSDEDLPDIDNYDIIKGKRTYRYFDREVLYPFGYGLTYTSFAYRNLTVTVGKDRYLQVSLKLLNTGKRTSDEVVQIYASAPASRVKKPIRQLIGFTRVKNMQPKEEREIRLEIPLEELRFYDVIRGKLMVEEGTYTIFAGRFSQDQALSTEVFIFGEKTGSRDMSKRIRADHYDDYENMLLTEGHLGFKGMTLEDPEKEGVLIYRDCDLTGRPSVFSLMFLSEQGCEVDVFVNGQRAGSFTGDTRTNEQKSAPKFDKLAVIEKEQRMKTRVPIFDEIDLILDPEVIGAIKAPQHAELKLVLHGEIKLCYLRMKEEKTKGRVSLGVAN